MLLFYDAGIILKMFIHKRPVANIGIPAFTAAIIVPQTVVPPLNF